MKILISYSSLTGNTKKLAEGIYEAFKENASLKSVNEDINIEHYDIILHGYWVDKGGPDPKSKTFLKKIKDKRVGVFATLGAYPDSDHAIQSLDRGVACLDSSNTCIGRFICQGKVSDVLQKRMKNLPKDHFHYPDERRLKRWADASTHPDEKDIQLAVKVFKDVL